MALKLPPNFENDIQGKDTNLIPLVVIGNNLTNPTDVGIFHSDWVHNSIHISTNIFSNTGSYYATGGWDDDYSFTTIPILLNIPSLKESIDIEKRAYRISSINIDINNFPYEGKRFSELIGDSSLINTEVRIFWWSQSTGHLFPQDKQPTASGDSRAFQIYFGTIRRYTHDDEKVRLVVEDRSQATLHKDLPTAELEFGDDVPSKYQGVKIPIVYGHVDRSPCVIGEQLESGEVKIFTDNPSSSSTIHADSNPLSIFRDDKYLEVLSDDLGNISHWGYSDGLQYTATNNIFLIATPYIQDVDNLDVKNPLGENMCAVKLIDSNYTYKLYTHLDNYSPTDLDKEYAFKAFFVNDLPEIYRTNVGGGDITTFYEYRIQLIFERLNKVDENYHQDSTEAHITYLINYDWSANAWNYEDAKYIDVRLQPEGDGTDIIIADTEGLASTTSEGVSQLPASNISYNHNIGWVNESVAEQALYSQTMRVFPSLTASSAYSNIIINEFTRIAYFLIDKFRSQDFYANVIGRLNDPSCPQVIINILDTELGVGNIEAEEIPPYDEWKYAFTVDSKINSKRLIENIASASPYIPRFNNMGEFRFDVIPPDEDSINADSLHTISEADCIDFSFSRSKIESVFSKIIFKFNWDYARGEFNDSVESDISLLGYEEDDETELYKHDYYGFKEIGEDIHAESTLEISDDRGKYIRKSDSHQTAQAFADWYLLWSCNQHLKMKIKLPLKYMNLEIGDMVKFDAILGGVKPYGIDYRNNGNVNGQAVYKNFLITSTNKTLEFVEIECVQMHHLDVDTADILFGCTNSNACNYDPNATNDDGTCDYGTNCFDGTQECDSDDCPENPNDDCPSGNYDCESVCDGDAVEDACGICGGDNSNCHDCAGEPNGDAVEDECGVCGGNNSTCAGCTDISATNYDDDADLDCSFIGYATETACCEYDHCRPFMDMVHIVSDDINFGNLTNINELVECNDKFSLDGEISHTFSKDTYTANYVDCLFSIKNEDAETITNWMVQEVKLKITSNDGFVDTIEGEVSGNIEIESSLIGGAAFQHSEVRCVYEGGAELFKLLPNNGEIEERGYVVNFVFTIKTYDHKNDDNLIEYEELVPITFNYQNCSAIGDVNVDGVWNVLDVVALANCVLADSCDDDEIVEACAADVNADGNYNVLDIVALANCVLADNCGDEGVLGG